MKVKKSLLIAAAATTIGIAGIGAIGTASAATNGRGDLTEKIATKFNLNESDVQTVFDEAKTSREAERQAKMSERLQALVDDGDITAEQKTLIENKQKELQAAREAEREALETWAEDNGIDMKYLQGGRGHKGGSGGRS